MQFVNLRQVRRNSVIKFLSPDGKFEGYARLIKPQTRALSFVEEAEHTTYVQQRWLVQFLPPDSLELTREEYFTQSNLKGKATSRIIAFEIKKVGEIPIQPEPEDDEDYNFPSDILIDDFNGIF